VEASSLTTTALVNNMAFYSKTDTLNTGDKIPLLGIGTWQVCRRLILPTSPHSVAHPYYFLTIIFDISVVEYMYRLRQERWKKLLKLHLKLGIHNRDRRHNYFKGRKREKGKGKREKGKGKREKGKGERGKGK
jgi:hypothetical protein